MLEKKWEYNETVHHVFIDFDKAFDSVRRDVMYSILHIEYGLPIELVTLIKIFCNKTYSKVCVGKICHLNFLFRVV
jgi:hypothetical protein